VGLQAAQMFKQSVSPVRVAYRLRVSGVLSRGTARRAVVVAAQRERRRSEGDFRD
jgi:hypothetical protein